MGYSIFNCYTVLFLTVLMTSQIFLASLPGHLKFCMLTLWTKSSIQEITMLSKGLLTLKLYRPPGQLSSAGGVQFKNVMAH